MKSHYTPWHSTGPGLFYGILEQPEPTTRTRPMERGDLPIYRLRDQDGAWSGFGGVTTPPTIGTRVRVICNGLGYGTVVAYFVEQGFLGVEVWLEQQPDWHKRQNPDRPSTLVFGLEVAAV